MLSKEKIKAIEKLIKSQKRCHYACDEYAMDMKKVESLFSVDDTIDLEKNHKELYDETYKLGDLIVERYSYDGHVNEIPVSPIF